MRALILIFILLFNSLTFAAMAEVERIKSHLRSVHELVTAFKPTGLTSQQLINRKRGLIALKKYIEAKNFPQNHDFPGIRIPYFIDEHGTPCAVAHIMIESGFESLARKISGLNNHIYLDQVDDSEVAKWVANSGFSLDELRLIQPSYAYRPRYQDLLLHMSYLGDEKRVREILKDNVPKVKLNLALQITAQTADAKIMEKKRREKSPRPYMIYYAEPPYVGQWAGVAQALIEKGADPYAKNSKGQSAIDLAKDPAVKAVLTGSKKLAGKF